MLAQCFAYGKMMALYFLEIIKQCLLRVLNNIPCCNLTETQQETIKELVNSIPLISLPMSSYNQNAQPLLALTL